MMDILVNQNANIYADCQKEHSFEASEVAKLNLQVGKKFNGMNVSQQKAVT